MEKHDGDAAASASAASLSQPLPVFKDLTMEDLYRGAIFRADVQEDFELEHYMDEESSDDEMEGLEIERKKRNNLYLPPPPLADIEAEMENLTSDGMVKKKIMSESGGLKPPLGSRLIFEYVAYPEGGKEFFDAATGKRANQVIVAEKCGLIIGLQVALKSMVLGEEAIVWMHHFYAYGILGCPPRIPAQKPVMFKIRLKGFRTPEEMKMVQYMSKQERKELTFDEILACVTKMRDDANEEFRKKRFQRAANRYRKSANILEDYSNLNDEQDMERVNMLVILHANAAAAYLRLEKAPQACNNCKRALELPVNVNRDKIYFRMAKAKFMLGGYSDALGYLEKARKAGAAVTICNALHQNILDKIKSDDDNLRTMCQMMFPR